MVRKASQRATDFICCLGVELPMICAWPAGNSREVAGCQAVTTRLYLMGRLQYLPRMRGILTDQQCHFSVSALQFQFSLQVVRIVYLLPFTHPVNIVCREEKAFQKLMRDRVHHAKSTLDTGRRKSKYVRRQHIPSEQSQVQPSAVLPLVAQDIDVIEGELLLSVHCKDAENCTLKCLPTTNK
jgi:hypothetical protein